LFKIFELICTYILSILNSIPQPEGNGSADETWNSCVVQHLSQCVARY